jgi:hypothetical protein
MKLAITRYPGDIPVSDKIALLERRESGVCLWQVDSPEAFKDLSKKYRSQIIGHMNGVQRRDARKDILSQINDD